MIKIIDRNARIFYLNSFDSIQSITQHDQEEGAILLYTVSLEDDYDIEIKQEQFDLLDVDSMFKVSDALYINSFMLKEYSYSFHNRTYGTFRFKNHGNLSTVMSIDSFDLISKKLDAIKSAHVKFAGVKLQARKVEG